MIYCVSSGGALIKYAQKLRVPYIQVKAGMPPRAAMPHMFMPLVKIMQELGQAPATVNADFAEATTLLETISKENAPEKRVDQNFAKTLATQLNGYTPVVYGFGLFRGVALRWKQQFNENAKVPAKWEYFSELNHNETMGWEGARELAKSYAVVLFREQSEPVEIRSRIETTKSLMEPNLQKIFEVWSQGKSTLAKMLSTILIGDFTSIYLALLRNQDPTPVKTVDVMKERIEANGFKKAVLSEFDKLGKQVLVANE
jgi:glucose/mannose-6-phosphate isomerase